MSAANTSGELRLSAFFAGGPFWNLYRGTRDPQLRCSTITNLEEEEPK
jgi:hypothetical protein